MGFNAFTLAETAYKAGLGQDFFRKLKDNFDDHESRLVQLQGGSRIIEHFIEDDGGGLSFFPTEYNHGGTGVNSDPAGWTGSWYVSRNGMYQGYDLSSRNGTIFNAAKPAGSVARVASIGSGGAEYANWYSLKAFHYAQVGLPIVLEARCKIGTDNPFSFGVRQGPFSERLSFGGVGADRNGIWLERVDASNWRFVAFDGTRQNGSNFTKVAAGTWFRVRIEFGSTPSALCYIDGTLKETLTAHLPTSSLLRAALLVCDTNLGGTSGTVDYDLVDYSCGSLLDAA